MSLNIRQSLVPSSVFSDYHRVKYWGKRADRWIEEATHMEAISGLYGSKFIRFLQHRFHS